MSRFFNQSLSFWILNLINMMISYLFKSSFRIVPLANPRKIDFLRNCGTLSYYSWSLGWGFPFSLLLTKSWYWIWLTALLTPSYLFPLKTSVMYFQKKLSAFIQRRHHSPLTFSCYNLLWHLPKTAHRKKTGTHFAKYSGFATCLGSWLRHFVLRRWRCCWHRCSLMRRRECRDCTRVPCDLVAPRVFRIDWSGFQAPKLYPPYQDL